MSLSLSEQHVLACPSCGTDVDAELWLIIDADEHPELVQALRDEQVNQIVCPNCGYTAPADAPVLFHDRRRRLVIFATPPSAVEDTEWRELARDLHALLVGSMPIEERRPYLSDVQVEQGLDGLRHALADLQPLSTPATVATPEPSAAATTAQPPNALLTAIEALLAVASPEEFELTVGKHSILLDPATDELLAQLADVAADEGQRDAAEALMQARFLLANLRRTLSGTPASVQPETTAAAPATAPASDGLSAELQEAIQALLTAQSEEELEQVLATHPQLLSETAQAALWSFAASARNTGDDELAEYALECRAMLRQISSRLANPADREPGTADT